MKLIVSSLVAFCSIPCLADDIAEKMVFVLKDPAVTAAVDAVVSEAQPEGQKSWFKGLVISETPTTCAGDRATFVLLYGRSVQKDGKTETQKCSQLVHFGDCQTTTGKISDVEKSPRCKSAR